MVKLTRNVMTLTLALTTTYMVMLLMTTFTGGALFTLLDESSSSPVIPLKDSKEISLTHPQCLSPDGADKLISSMKRVYIVMPAKAAGTTINDLVKRCMDSTGFQYEHSDYRDNEEFVTSALNLPPLLSAHLFTQDGMEQLVKYTQHATKDSLVIYVHREETNRLSSAIKHFLVHRMCDPQPDGEQWWYTPPNFVDFAEVSEDKTKCVINEKDAMRATRRGITEIGSSGFLHLTCDTYDAIEENAPNFWFVNYQKVDELRLNLEKRFCPDIAKEPPIRKNISSDETMKTYIRLGKDDKEVTLDEWVEAKESLLEWTLDLKHNVTCQAKTRRIENSIDMCDDGILQVSSAMQSYLQ